MSDSLPPSNAPSDGADDFSAALEAIEHAVRQFDGCTAAERDALAAQLHQLREMGEKLRSGRVEIAVFGEISTGKSALINALVGEAATQVSVRGGWTKDVWHVPWKGVGYCVPGFEKSEVVLVDTPGLNEVDGAQRGMMARDAAQRADLVLFVTDSDLNEGEFSALVELAASHKPIILVLNKSDLYSREELADLIEQFRGRRMVGFVEPENVIAVSADPREVEYEIETASGKVKREWRKPEPDIEALRLRILTVLEHEGKALLALNASMYAADRSDRLGAMRVRMRSEKANNTIWTYAVIKSVAVALNPIPVLDVSGGMATDVAMVIHLGRIFGIEITTANAKQLVVSILKAAGWIMLGEAVITVASSFFKGLTLGTGTALTALPQGAAAGYGSYIVGQAARYYFEHGASWGDRGPKTVVQRILENTDKQSVLEHLKVEIKKKISVNQYAGK